MSEANRIARLTRCKQLLKRYDDSAVDFIWFTDEKVFTVEPPITLRVKFTDFFNSAERSVLRAGRNQEAIHSTTRSTFSKSAMV